MTRFRQDRRGAPDPEVLLDRRRDRPPVRHLARRAARAGRDAAQGVRRHDEGPRLPRGFDEGRPRCRAGRRREDPGDRRRPHPHARTPSSPRPSSRWNPRTPSSARNEEAPSVDRDRRLRSLPRFPRRRGAGGRHRAHLADAGAARDLRALHLQSRMGRERAVVREILDPGDAQGRRHHWAADRVLAAFPLLGVLRATRKARSNRPRTSRARRSARRNGRTRPPSTCAAGSTTSTASSSPTSTGIRPAPTSPGAPRRSS